MNKRFLVGTGLGLLVLAVVGYFVFYVPYSNQLAYQRNVGCAQMANAYWTNMKAEDIQQFGSAPGTYFPDPISHFNSRLNTCLVETHIVSVDLKSSSGDQLISRSVIDVVSGKALIQDSVDLRFAGNSVSTTTVAGLPDQDFERQEAALMGQ